jgi:hypothetical protein
MAKRRLEKPESSPTKKQPETGLVSQRETNPISSAHDWVQITMECEDIRKIRRVFVVFGEITLYNLHRIIHYSGNYEDNLGLEHAFYIRNEKYGSGIGDNTKRLNDRKVRFMQVLQNTGETFQYVYGQLRCSLVVIATKNGTKEKLSWLPKLCSGSKGTFPPESACSDLQLIRSYRPTRYVNIDKINKTYMHERFGANQQTNKVEKRVGPSILCQSSEPHSTISLIYKRPIISIYDSSEDSEDEEIVRENKENDPRRNIRMIKVQPVHRVIEKSPNPVATNFLSLLTPRT